MKCFAMFVLGGILTSSSLGYGKSPENLATPSRVTFSYIDYASDFEFPCVAEQLQFYGWLVDCQLGDTLRRHYVHLAITRYQPSAFGKSAYEVLYWITDRSDAARPHHSSSTIWVHNDHGDNRVERLTVSQGLQNDLAGLMLTFQSSVVATSQTSLP